MKIEGVDLSHWNDEKRFLSIMNDDNVKFVILKATEGKSMLDEMCAPRYMQAYNKKIVGFYHYAHPELNSMIDEAQNFVTRVQEITAFNPNAKYFLALDWEGKAVKYSYATALIFLDEVYRLTGIRPMIYMSQGYVEQYDPISKYNYGLWVARYNEELGSVGAWKTPAIWQYTSSPYDKNIFYGSEEQLMKYCESDTIDTPVIEKKGCYFQCGNIDKCPIARFVNGMD